MHFYFQTGLPIPRGFQTFGMIFFGIRGREFKERAWAALIVSSNKVSKLVSKVSNIIIFLSLKFSTTP